MVRRRRRGGGGGGRRGGGGGGAGDDAKNCIVCYHNLVTITGDATDDDFEFRRRFGIFAAYCTSATSYIDPNDLPADECNRKNIPFCTSCEEDVEAIVRSHDAIVGHVGRGSGHDSIAEIRAAFRVILERRDKVRVGVYNRQNSISDGGDLNFSFFRQFVLAAYERSLDSEVDSIMKGYGNTYPREGVNGGNSNEGAPPQPSAGGDGDSENNPQSDNERQQDDGENSGVIPDAVDVGESEDEEAEDSDGDHGVSSVLVGVDDSEKVPTTPTDQIEGKEKGDCEGDEEEISDESDTAQNNVQVGDYVGPPPEPYYSSGYVGFHREPLYSSGYVAPPPEPQYSSGYVSLVPPPEPSCSTANPPEGRPLRGILRKRAPAWSPPHNLADDHDGSDTSEEKKGPFYAPNKKKNRVRFALDESPVPPPPDNLTANLSSSSEEKTPPQKGKDKGRSRRGKKPYPALKLKNFTCPDCGQSFASSKTRSAHISDSHQDSYPEKGQLIKTPFQSSKVTRDADNETEMNSQFDDERQEDDRQIAGVIPDGMAVGESEVDEGQDSDGVNGVTSVPKGASSKKIPVPTTLMNDQSDCEEEENKGEGDEEEKSDDDFTAQNEFSSVQVGAVSMEVPTAQNTNNQRGGEEEEEEGDEDEEHHIAQDSVNSVPVGVVSTGEGPTIPDLISANDSVSGGSLSPFTNDDDDDYEEGLQNDNQDDQDDQGRVVGFTNQMNNSDGRSQDFVVTFQLGDNGEWTQDGGVTNQMDQNDAWSLDGGVTDFANDSLPGQFDVVPGSTPSPPPDVTIEQEPGDAPFGIQFPNGDGDREFVPVLEVKDEFDELDTSDIEELPVGTPVQIISITSSDDDPVSPFSSNYVSPPPEPSFLGISLPPPQKPSSYKSSAPPTPELSFLGVSLPPRQKPSSSKSSAPPPQKLSSSKSSAPAPQELSFLGVSLRPPQNLFSSTSSAPPPPEPSFLGVSLPPPQKLSSSKSSAPPPQKLSSSKSSAPAPQELSFLDVSLFPPPEPSFLDVSLSPPPEPSFLGISLSPPQKPSSSKISVQPPSQPSTSKACVARPSQPSTSKDCVPPPSQPSTSKACVPPPSQPFCSSADVCSPPKGAAFWSVPGKIASKASHPPKRIDNDDKRDSEENKYPSYAPPSKKTKTFQFDEDQPELSPPDPFEDAYSRYHRDKKQSSSSKSEKENQFPCPDCDRSYATALTRSAHMSKCHPEKCSTTKRQPITSAPPKNSDAKKAPTKHYCGLYGCISSFFDKDKLEAHRRRKHKNNE